MTDSYVIKTLEAIITSMEKEGADVISLATLKDLVVSVNEKA